MGSLTIPMRESLMKVKSKKSKSKAIPTSELITSDFYVVSPKKFLIMFLGTMGGYALYWFYRHWENYKIASGHNVWPAVRAFFSIFFAPILFKNIASKQVDQSKEMSKKVDLLGTSYVLAYVASAAGDRLSAANIGNPYTIFMSLILMPVICWCLYQTQLIANSVCNDPNGESNNTLSSLNYLWLVLGACYWVFTILFLRYKFLSVYM
tara:strand:- start:3250 stop:3873 length:624 start_codon:yes stop_codon:yes gene_type:complete